MFLNEGIYTFLNIYFLVVQYVWEVDSKREIST